MNGLHANYFKNLLRKFLNFEKTTGFFSTLKIEDFQCSETRSVSIFKVQKYSRIHGIKGIHKLYWFLDV